MVKSRPFYARELTQYPTSGYRVWLLFIVLLANFIAAYESQIASVVPLILKDLHLSLTQYGAILAISTVVQGIAAFITSPLGDKYGRVSLLIPCLFVTALCLYAIALIESVSGFLILRVMLSLFGGVSYGLTAGLVRDYSPRMGRALAYAFWSLGPAGSSFFAAAIAGWTLPYFNHWHSQFYIQGTVSLLGSILVLFSVKDLSPKLRALIIHSKEHAEQVNEEIKAGESVEKHGKLREIMMIPRLWLLALGISLFSITFLTMQSFGPTLMVEAFHFPVAKAASMIKYFWLWNLLSLLVAGYISDRLMLRKIVSLVGAVLTMGFVVYFITLLGKTVTESQIIVSVSMIGCVIGIAYGPWLALYSENAEDVKASLQSASWGLVGFVFSIVGVSAAIVIPTVVSQHGWRSWMLIDVIAGLLYIPLLFTAKGRWFPVRKSIEISQKSVRRN